MCFSAGAASITKILGEIMMTVSQLQAKYYTNNLFASQLNESIEKYLKTLQKNPVMSLKLKHGFTRKVAGTCVVLFDVYD
jgi:hypothetical protein